MASILVIDDASEIREILREILEQAGHVVRIASNGNNAIKLFRKDVTDLVITDILMPEKEGLETIRELRKINPNLKIIAISGGGRINAKSYLAIAKSFGAEKTIPKPFGNRDILNAVDELITPTNK